MSLLAVGGMSGTSADGVSFALASFRGRAFKLLQYKTYPYPDSLTRQILKGPQLTAAEISRLNVEIGQCCAHLLVRFLRQSEIPFAEISVVGSHGQTIYHGGGDKIPNTLQIGEPSFMTESTGIPVVSDFRTADLAAGGTGAPLIPFFDHFFFGQGKTRALQNIGGIANVTVTGKPAHKTAFDTGPGNCLIDWAVRQFIGRPMNFDRGGKIAADGRIDFEAVRKMAAHPYFKKKPPKSTGRELFNERFIPESLKRAKGADLVATLTYFTAYAIHQSYERFVKDKVTEVIVSGGGALNATLMKHLAGLFSPVPVRSIETYGIPAQAKEPLAFAFFALRALEGKINHWPEGTGARKACVLGKMIHANP